MQISPVNYAALSYSFPTVVTILFEYTSDVVFSHFYSFSCFYSSNKKGPLLDDGFQRNFSR